MTFSRQILVGLAAGIAVGVFFGELVAPLDVVADGFVKLLQMTVLPYVTVSIIVSVGSLDAELARRLGVRAGLVIIGLWLVALVYMLLFPLVFPPTETAAFFSTSLVERPAPFDFVNLYIPSNPFHSLANNVVPAVVLFSVILGVSLIGMERKAVLLDVLRIISDTIARATRFVVRLTPYGVFALSARAAGTLQLEQLERIQVYLITYVAMSLLVSLWVLPGLVAALTPIRWRDVIQPMRDALITAFVAGDLFIVLPILVESSRTLLERYHVTDASTASLPDVIVPASFNFPHTGKLLSLSFVLFASWFVGASIPVLEYPRFALTGLLTSFGSLNAVVPFLLDVFRVPADTFQLFLATSVINSRFGTLAAALHTVTVALLGSAAIAGALRVEPRRLIRYGVITVVLTTAVVGGLRIGFRTLLASEFKGAEVVYGMRNYFADTAAPVVTTPDPVERTRDIAAAVQSRGVLRVAFAAPRLPFVFRNARGELVGYDVELASRMARDLEVGLELVEIRPEELVAAVADGRFDLGIGGFPVTPRGATRGRYSSAYLNETVAFVVRDHLRSRFETWASIADARDLTIGVPPLPYYERELRARLPGVPMRTYSATSNPLDDSAGFDAVALPAERGAVMTLLDPRWSVVVPQPGVIKVPVAFPLPRHDQSWAAFVDTWIELKRADGSLEALYDHWILGRTARPREPRWSIIRNVLHWVD